MAAIVVADRTSGQSARGVGARVGVGRLVSATTARLAEAAGAGLGVGDRGRTVVAGLRESVAAGHGVGTDPHDAMRPIVRAAQAGPEIEDRIEDPPDARAPPGREPGPLDRPGDIAVLPERAASTLPRCGCGR
jgi:hypothetical protein